jgi:hypothetical protein
MIYKSLFLDPGTHDIVFKNGSIQFTSEGEITLQKIKTKLLFFSGDYFLNENAGVDYLKYVFEKGVSDESIQNLFISVFQKIPEITEIIDLKIERQSMDQKSDQKVFISFKVKDRNGEILEGEV